MKSLLRHPLAPDVVIAACALFLTALYVTVGGGGFALDDSWIHQTYGRNLGLTGVWAFVPGVPSGASTSPLYTVLLALGYRLGVPFGIWTHGLGAAALAMTGLVARRLALRAAPAMRGVGLAAGLACVFSWHLIWAAASGMETALFSMWTLLLPLLAWRELDTSRSRPWVRAVLFGLVSALAALTRPEAILLAGLCGVALLLARPRPLRSMLGWLALVAGVSLLVLLPYFLFNLQVAGSLLPGTNAAKQGEFAMNYAAPYLARIGTLLEPLAAGATLLFLPGVIAYTVVHAGLARRERRAWLALLLPAWPLALLFLYAAWLPLNYHHGRYLIPMLPCLLVCGVAGTGLLLRRAQPSFVWRPLTRVLALSGGLVTLMFALVLGLSAYARDVAIINEEMVAPAQWVAAHIPLDKPLASHDIGALGYFAPRPLLDTAGLISPEVIPILHDEAALWALFETRGIRYLMAFPDQLPGKRSDDPRLCPVFMSGGATSAANEGPEMTIYTLAYDGACPP